MSVSNPWVSVIIPFYNCPYVAQAIESILKQTYPNVELIVVNDGSNEHQHLIIPYLNKIIYIEKKTNNGVASAINQGIQQAKGEYLVWLSSDDIIDPYKVEYQLRFMQEKNSFISFTNFNKIDKNSRIIQSNVIPHNAEVNYKNDLKFLQALKNYNPINGCTVMMSRKIIERVGYFNENLKYAQDYEYWIRVALQFPIHYFPSTLTSYRVHDAMGTIRHYKEQIEEFDSIKSQYKYMLDYLIQKKINASIKHTKRRRNNSSRK